MMMYDLWLQVCLGIANTRAIKAINYFGSAQSIYNAGRAKLTDCKIFKANEIEKLSTTDIKAAKNVLDDCKRRDISVITISDKRYPERLLNIENPPLVLYYRGNFPDFNSLPTISIVGPRKITSHGRKCAFSLGLRLSRGGFIVVSGGALGGDTAAHLGALAADGVTVAVLGCGLDYPYLPENEKLRKRISNKGCVMSEYPPMYPASKYTFPVRNRIMSGLSLGVVLVEAPRRSGSLITVNHAIEQNRDVFVVPGNAGVKAYEGSNQLLQDGAIVLLSARDVFNEYLNDYPDKINIELAYSPLESKSSDKNEKNNQNLQSTLSKTAKIVYNNLNTQIFYPDEISDDGLTSGEILAALTELEISGYIKAVPGGRYSKTNR